MSSSACPPPSPTEERLFIFVLLSGMVVLMFWGERRERVAIDMLGRNPISPLAPSRLIDLVCDFSKASQLYDIIIFFLMGWQRWEAQSLEWFSFSSWHIIVLNICNRFSAIRFCHLVDSIEITELMLNRGIGCSGIDQI